jgi:hypothetical protein
MTRVDPKFSRIKFVSFRCAEDGTWNFGPKASALPSGPEAQPHLQTTHLPKQIQIEPPPTEPLRRRPPSPASTTPPSPPPVLPSTYASFPPPPCGKPWQEGMAPPPSEHPLPPAARRRSGRPRAPASCCSRAPSGQPETGPAVDPGNEGDLDDPTQRKWPICGPLPLGGLAPPTAPSSASSSPLKVAAFSLFPPA